jgi:hypothetical protein
MDDDARDHRPLAALARNSSPLASQKDSPSSIQGGAGCLNSARPDLCEGRTAMSVPGRDHCWLPSRARECEAPLDNQRDTLSHVRHPARLEPAYPSRADAGVIICRGREGCRRANQARFSHAGNSVRGRRSNCRAGVGLLPNPYDESSGKMAPSSCPPLAGLKPVNVRGRRRACAARGEIRSRQPLLAQGPQVGPPPRPPH